MAAVKSVNRSASVALAPDAPYLAAGTMAGAVDLSFSTSAFLEIFTLDFQSDDKELPLLGQSASSERFNRLSWGKAGSDSKEFSLGLIAGGLIDGNIAVWNPLTMIRSESDANPLVAQLTKHKGPVRGLQFNSFTPNLLASGADEGEICIWDLASPTQPSHFPPLKGSGGAAQGEISYLAWNSKVQHILASTSYNGATVVWDLKKQKPVISFSDSNRRRCSVLQWNPDMATQLAIASDDDNSSAIRLWDMRNTLSPVKEFLGHTKGVISMSWCPSDSAYLLTCGKDNRTICWDTISGEIAHELPAGANWNFDVHWYSKIPGIISASSFDGKIGIYNIEGCGRYGAGESNISAAPLRAPKRYKRPVGVSFGFGGKLVSFQSRLQPGGAATGSSEVYVHNIVTEDGLLKRSSDFASAIQNAERDSLRSLCETKLQESQSESDKETWGFLKVMFEDDGTARTKLLSHLGFSLPEEVKDSVVQDDIAQQIDALGIEEKVDDTSAAVDNKETGVFSYDNGEDFFNNLPSPKTDTPVSTSANHFAGEATVPGEDHLQEDLHEQEGTFDPAFDDAVQRALVVGDYKGAVAQCISANRMADALVIAHVGGASLWESTRDQYLKKNRSPYLKVVAAMVNHDLMALVRTRPLKSWKETLALVCTFAQRDEWTTLCDTLASKLMTAGNTLAATLCYICAGNIDKTVEIWSQGLSGDSEEKSYLDRLQDLMEKTITFALATGQKGFSASLCKLVEKYAEILASQGLLSTALEYLKFLGEDLSSELLVLRDRITLSNEPVYEAPVAQPRDTQLGYHMPEDSSHHYPGIAHHQPPVNSYLESHQPQPHSYPTSTPYPPSPQQPHMFYPSPAPQIMQPGFAPNPATSQPAVKPFMPSPAPMLRNADKYQQLSTSTLGSQLYSGTTVQPPYQPGAIGATSLGGIPPPQGPITNLVPGPMMPNVVAPTTTSRTFTPVVSPGVSQPASPAHSAPPTTQAVAPAAPPPTVQTVDTSNVPAHQKPIVVTLTRLFNESSEILGGARASVAKRKEIDNNSLKIGSLFDSLNKGLVSKNAADKLTQLCQALDQRDYGTALQIQVILTTSDWDECQAWLAALKRMIKLRQGARM